MDSWKDSYADLVAAFIAGRNDVTLDELCRQLDMLRDDLEGITERLEARGVIERDQRQPDTFTA